MSILFKIFIKFVCDNKSVAIKNGSNAIGYKSIDFRRLQNLDDTTKYYYKHSEYACYTCIVNSLNEDINLEDLPPTVQKSYYTALARERYDLDKITKMLNYTKTTNQ